jgi:hypothetical protein
MAVTISRREGARSEAVPWWTRDRGGGRSQQEILVEVVAMRLVRTVVLTVCLAGLGLALAAAPAGAQSAPTLVAVRAAHHNGFDRVTFEFRGGLPSHQVAYVDRLTADPSDQPVPLAGNAVLRVVFHGANAHDDSGRATAPRHLTPGLPVLKEIRNAGDFEAVVTYGLGLDHRVPLRVSTLSGPSRVVIDLETGGQAAGTLPFTGSHGLGELLTGLGLVAAGGAALALGHRTRAA